MPHVLERDHRELASPTESDGTAAEDGEDVVAAVLGAVEAGVGALPTAVDGVRSIWLAYDVLEGYLEVNDRIIIIIVLLLRLLLLVNTGRRRFERRQFFLKRTRS